MERQLSNGKWIQVATEELKELCLQAVLRRESWFAPRVGRAPMTTTAEVQAYLLATGKAMSTGDDWYDQIRIARASAPVSRTPSEVGLSDAIARAARNEARHDRDDYSHDEAPR